MSHPPRCHISEKITPTHAPQASSNQLILKSKPLPEYDTFHSIDDLVSNPVVGVSLSRRIPAEQYTLQLITCRAT